LLLPFVLKLSRPTEILAWKVTSELGVVMTFVFSDHARSFATNIYEFTYPV